MMSGRKQILWVDDEIEYLRAHILFLEEHNYEVSKANNGDDALVMVREKDFDLVFLDEQMPGKDGLTTLEEIKQYNSQLPVVMVTKSEEEQLMEEAFGRNIDGYLTKPVNPSQILSVCKRILHSKTIRKTHITSEYVQEYAAYKARFMTNQTPKDWSSLFASLCRWDSNLPTLKDQGLDATHENHKKEVSKKFIHFIEDNYLSWFGGRGKNPFLINKQLQENLFPVLKENNKACLLVMTGFRWDQWLTIRDFLEPYFGIEEKIAWTMLPSDRLYCRTALFSGMVPNKVSLEYPELWKKLEEEEVYRDHEKELLKINMEKNGLDPSIDPSVFYIQSMKDSDQVLKNLEDHDSSPFLTLVVEFADLLANLRQESSLLMEIAPNEGGYKELTRIWFQGSNLLKILRHFSASGRHVFLASDHGSVLVDQPVEVFCQEEKTPHPRVKKGKGISCDERHVFFIESPSIFGLPSEDADFGYAIAKENFYFTYPNKYQYFGSKFKGQMASGGISMEELLVPFISLGPKG